MRILAISDIHNNLTAVRKLVFLERGAFDCVVVAGDIGSDCAPTFFQLIASYNCPIMYVLGNWDNKVSYRASFGPSAHLIHLNSVEVGGFTFTGFSGCPAHWGQNPIAKRVEARHAPYQRILERNREVLAKEWRRSRAASDKTIVVTHERLHRLEEIVPNALLHLFGHIHRPKVTTHRGTTFANVSVLDRRITVHQPEKLRVNALRNVNAGNYSVIEISRSGVVTVTRNDFPWRYEGWVVLEKEVFRSAKWVDQELIWYEASDLVPWRRESSSRD